MKVLLLPFAQAHRNRNLGEAGGVDFQRVTLQIYVKMKSPNDWYGPFGYAKHQPKHIMLEAFE